MGNRREKLKLYEKDPRCFWCQRITFNTNISSFNKEPHPLTATVDHIFSKFNPRRWIKMKPGEIRKVLSCYECNQKRSIEENKHKTKDELTYCSLGFTFNPKKKNLFEKTFDSLDQVIDHIRKNHPHPKRVEEILQNIDLST